MLCQGWSSICILFQGSVCCCKAEIAQARSYRARTASRASYNVLRLLLWMNQLLQSVARRVFSKFLSHLRCFWIELPSSLAPSPPPTPHTASPSRPLSLFDVSLHRLGVLLCKLRVEILLLCQLGLLQSQRPVESIFRYARVFFMMLQ